jgi:Holliday junction DNA helicase RuvA
MTSQELILAVENGDCDRLCLTPGIGKKMAERAILELKGKLQTSLEFTPSQGLFAAPATTPNSIRTDISNALESLGYSTKEITLVLKQLPEVSDLSSGIKQALKILSSK